MFSRFQDCENGYQKKTGQFRETAGCGLFIHWLTFHLLGGRIINYFEHLGFEAMEELQIETLCRQIEIWNQDSTGQGNNNLYL